MRHIRRYGVRVLAVGGIGASLLLTTAPASSAQYPPSSVESTVVTRSSPTSGTQVRGTQLSRTGSNVDDLARGALVLVAAGGVVVAGARSRRNALTAAGS